MQKILVIGQAPAAKKQKFPYDTTMLYYWLAECGIDMVDAQEMFIFDAIYDKFPGWNEVGGHNKPTKEQMDQYWPILESKIQGVDKVWLLGNVAEEYFNSKPKTWSCNLLVLKTIHPSKRNIDIYNRTRDELINKIKNFLYE